jgi:hypothetical protein
MITTLISDVSNYQYAAWLIGYALLLSALMVSIFGHVAWRVSRRMVRHHRVRQELRQVRDEAYRERQLAIDRDAYRRIG